ncbi:MAG: MATE family efflux transporter [Spirochaetaceae bacterium]|jgi:putative MATE family efflux protein|nr:MATE family efflux transporter [Spirochaetaceae bacterium]
MKIPQLFDDKQFYKSLFTIAVPIMFQNLINSLVNMLDTVMIGRLGTIEIAAVGLGNNFFFLYNMFLFGICSGGAIFTAQFWGSRDIAGIRKNTGFCLILSVSMGMLFTVAAVLVPERILGIYSKDPEVVKTGTAYLRTLAPAFIPYSISFVFILTLRSVERVRLAMITTLIALSLNLTLNYVFIFGFGPIPAMGVAGAATATVISRITEMLIMISVSYVRRYPPAGTIPEFLGFNADFVRRFIRIAFPVIVNEIIWSLGVSAQNIIFARTHTDAIAAFNITNTVSQLTWVFFIGLGNGVATLIGKKIGERNDRAARDYASRIIRFAPLIAFAAAPVLLLLSRLLPYIFKVTPAVLTHAGIMFIILTCSYPFRAFNMSMVIGICRAGGDTVFCMIYDLVFMWTAALPLAGIASFFFNAPVWVIYLCLCSEEPLKAILGFQRYKSGKWLRHVTE